MKTWESVCNATTRDELQKAIIAELIHRAWQERAVATIGRTTKLERTAHKHAAQAFETLANHLKQQETAMKTKPIREQLYDAVSDQSAQACINQHTRNIHTLYAMPNGRMYWGEEVSANSWDVLAGTVYSVAVIYQTGTGSCACNCDACMAGDDPAEWAGDDANELLDELIAKVGAIEVGYFDDERKDDYSDLSLRLERGVNQ